MLKQLSRPAEKDTAAVTIVTARAGWSPDVLPVSTCLPAEPASPVRVSSLRSFSSSSSTSSSSNGSAGHLVAGRNSTGFQEVSLLEPQEGAAGSLNGMLAKVLDKRRSKETELLRNMEAEHAAMLERKEKLHAEELDMKDAAHRRTINHMEAEMDELRAQLEAALKGRDTAERGSQQLCANLETERRLRQTAQQEHECLQRLLEAELLDD